MKRGEVWWAELEQPQGRHPVLLLSRNSAYEKRTAVTVAFVTSHIRNLPVEVSLSTADGMPKECVVNTDDLYTIKKGQMIVRITELSEEKRALVTQAILYALDLKL